MFRIRACIFILAILMAGSTAFSQDIHYTQFNLAPLTLNPSLTGNYEGTLRVGGLYRDQWRSIMSNQFITPSFYIDAPVRGFSKQGKDWFGIGAVIVHDEAGDVAFTNTSILGSLSYHLALDANRKTVISLGGQAGTMQKRVDLTDARFGDVLDGSNASSADLSNINNDRVSYWDFNAGLNLRSQLNDAMNFNIGFSVMHLSQPNYSTYTEQVVGTLTSDEIELPRRMVTHAQFNADLNPKWTLSPTFLYQAMEGQSEILVQTMAGHHFNAEKDITFSFGAGYRLRDAASALLGFDYKGLKVGVAYDINVSELTAASANRGGFEIAASYIVKIKKYPVVKPIIFCPRF